MKAGTKVRVMGVRRRGGRREGRIGYVVIPHVEQFRDLGQDGELGYDDANLRILRKEGGRAIVLVPNPEPEGRLSVLVDGTVLHCDAADVEEAD